MNYRLDPELGSGTGALGGGPRVLGHGLWREGGQTVPMRSGGQ